MDSLETYIAVQKAKVSYLRTLIRLGGTASRRDLRQATTMAARPWFDAALPALITDGLVFATPAPQNGTRYSLAAISGGAA